MRSTALILLLAMPCVRTAAQESGPQMLDDRFSLPDGFRIYRYAAPDVAPGGYSIAFDGDGRVYVGAGGWIVRLEDRDKDGVAEAAETIATGLGGRTPQGLLIVGSRFYVTSGKGLLIMEDPDERGRLRKRRRVGAPFQSGGDHGAHSLVLGQDGFIYFVAGNGSRVQDRSHITEETSPVLGAVGATVFRIDPEGARWEAVATGGRNPYGFALSPLNEIFLVDSDGEWSTALPWYGPVRLCHYPVGGDRGWRRGNRCWPTYYLDIIPGVETLGRGSPTGSVFYEHTQFPERYRGAFLVGDYMWKRADNRTHAYASSGRVTAFMLKRRGPSWEASGSERLAIGKAGARGFAVLDMAVAPDGSLLVTGHGSGVYRIFYDPDKKGPGPLVPRWPAPAVTESGLLDELLSLPQPREEWSRARQMELRSRLPNNGSALLMKAALDESRPVAQRLRALRHLSSGFAKAEIEFLRKLAADPKPVIRAQATWLLGLRGDAASTRLLERGVKDPDPLVRRRALEGLSRRTSDVSVETVLPALGDSNRWVRYAATMTMSRWDPDRWVSKALSDDSARVRTAALAALAKGAHRIDRDLLRGAIRRLIDEAKDSSNSAFVLEVLRVILLHEASVEGAIHGWDSLPPFLTGLLTSEDVRLVRESARVAGTFRLGACVEGLVAALEKCGDFTEQMHLMMMIAPIKEGWSPVLVDRVVRWLDRSDSGEINEPRAKGVHFPNVWKETVRNFAERHAGAVVKGIEGYSLSGAFGEVALDVAAERGGVSREKLDALRKLHRERTRVRPGVKAATDSRLRTDEEIRSFLLSGKARGGDAKRGLAVFQRTGCATCHTAGGGGRVLGPDLPKSLRDKPLEYVVESLVDPSAQVEEKYRTRVLVTKDEQILQGFMVEQNEREIVLIDGARALRVARDEIARMRASTTSVMPPGLVNRLTTDELKDLLAFLRP